MAQEVSSAEGAGSSSGLTNGKRLYRPIALLDIKRPRDCFAGRIFLAPVECDDSASQYEGDPNDHLTGNQIYQNLANARIAELEARLGPEIPKPKPKVLTPKEQRALEREQAAQAIKDREAEKAAERKRKEMMVIESGEQERVIQDAHKTEAAMKRQYDEYEEEFKATLTSQSGDTSDISPIEQKTSHWSKTGPIPEPPKKSLMPSWNLEHNPEIEENRSDVAVDGRPNQNSGSKGGSKAIVPYQREPSKWDALHIGPSVEWEGRSAYNNLSKDFAAAIDNWVLCDKEMGPEPSFVVDTSVPEFLEGKLLVDGSTTELYTDMLYPITIIDPADFDTVEGAPKTAEMACQKAIREEEEAEARYAARVAKEKKEKKQAEIEARNRVNPWWPEVNIYIRPMARNDIQQVTAIYNQWIDSPDFIAPDTTKLTVDEMQSRFNAVQTRNLPALVAINKYRAHKFVGEQIYGFAMAESTGSRYTVFRATVELSVYVRHDKLRKGVGRCLMDLLMASTDPLWSSHRGCEFHDFAEQLPQLYKFGGGRHLGKLVFSVLSRSGEDLQSGWLRKWLAKFGFDKCCTNEDFCFVADKADDW